MINNVKHAIALCGVLFGLALFCWYNANKDVTYRLDANTLSSLPDHQITELDLRQFDHSGVLVHQLKSPFVHHVPKRNQHWMQTPLIVTTEPNKPAWNLHANEAISYDAGKEIHFLHHVILNHATSGTLKTSRITYFPKQQLASTQAKVTWTQLGNTIKSQGMLAHLDTHQIDLLSDARATYDPTTRHANQ